MDRLMKRAPRTPADHATRLTRLKEIVPFFPVIPLVPAGLLIGLSLGAVILSIRANRRLAALEAELHWIERHEELHREPLETISP